MCTISFVPVSTERWLLGMNRDERKNRATAIPPELHHTERGTAYLSPIDAEAGGTWIGINAHGLILMLINNYQAVNPEAAHRSDLLSRGLIIPELMDSTTVDQVLNATKQTDPGRYNPFTLFVFARREQRIAYYGWDGTSVDTGDISPEPLIRISSGFDPDEAYRVRYEDFSRRFGNGQNINVDWIKSLHQSTWPEPGALSIAMIQQHVMSVSASVLEVTPGKGELHYCNGWPGDTKSWIGSTISFE